MPLLALERLVRQPVVTRSVLATDPDGAAAASSRGLEERGSCGVSAPATSGIPDYGRGRPLTLGERKSLARRPDRAMLDRLLHDPHPDVIRRLLRNPRLTEDDVVRLAARRPGRPEVLVENRAVAALDSLRQSAARGHLESRHPGRDCRAHHGAPRAARAAARGRGNASLGGCSCALSRAPRASPSVGKGARRRTDSIAPKTAQVAQPSSSSISQR